MDTLTYRVSPPTSLSRRALVALAVEHGEAADDQARRISLREGERAFECLRRTGEYDLWLIHWGPNSGTPLHDHGDSAGALYVVEGELVERRPRRVGSRGLKRRKLLPYEVRSMSVEHVHSIANESATTATTVHVYSPPLWVMSHYEVGDRAGLRVVHRELVT